MATLVLTALGTAVGGPIGGVIGAVIGRQADQAVFGGADRSGPRLKELAVTTSSYGQAIPRQFGRMRSAGTVIWATDLVESKSTDGGGKGQPSTTTYTYSVSFAVAVSSAPISEVRRVWADGKLLRGAAGDLKVGGEMRTYLGFGDDPVDPLIAADRGGDAPAFRDCAYVVFESLDLGDFGNRIPALTFEVVGEDSETVRMDRLVPQAAPATQEPLVLPRARGFADEGGPIAHTLAAIDRVYPLSFSLNGDAVSLSATIAESESVPSLPEPLADPDRDEGPERRETRGEDLHREPIALRYYDEDRDYQPGVQRAIGPRPEGREDVLDLPATMTANDAKLLANANAHRARWHHEQVTWRCGELDPAIRPGGVVRIPGRRGHWLVRSWEWHDGGIELGLERLAPALGDSALGDAGSSRSAIDMPVPPTRLRAFELPSDGTVSPDAHFLFVAATGATQAWGGAALFVEQGSALAQIGTTGARRSIMGSLVHELPPSQPHLIEPNRSLEVEVEAEDAVFPSTDFAGLAGGANRLMVGSEILQYLSGEKTAPTRWKLTGLLRARAGTEAVSLSSHAPGSGVLYLDETVSSLDPARFALGSLTRLTAIGRGDAVPVHAQLENAGESRRPLVPVHPRIAVNAADAYVFEWTRRGRGQWKWDDLVDVPLVEEREEYVVGFGSVDEPYATWLTNAARIEFAASSRAELLNEYGPAPLWVKQVGTYSHSLPLLLGHFS